MNLGRFSYQKCETARRRSFGTKILERAATYSEPIGNTNEEPTPSQGVLTYRIRVAKVYRRRRAWLSPASAGEFRVLIHTQRTNCSGLDEPTSGGELRWQNRKIVVDRTRAFRLSINEKEAFGDEHRQSCSSRSAERMSFDPFEPRLRSMDERRFGA